MVSLYSFNYLASFLAPFTSAILLAPSSTIPPQLDSIQHLPTPCVASCNIHNQLLPGRAASTGVLIEILHDVAPQLDLHLLVDNSIRLLQLLHHRVDLAAGLLLLEHSLDIRLLSQGSLPRLVAKVLFPLPTPGPVPRAYAAQLLVRLLPRLDHVVLAGRFEKI